MSDSGAARPGKPKRAKARGKCLGDLRAQYHRRNVMRQVRRAVASAREKGTWRRLREKTQVHKHSPPTARRPPVCVAVSLCQWTRVLSHGLMYCLVTVPVFTLPPEKREHAPNTKWAIVPNITWAIAPNIKWAIVPNITWACERCWWVDACRPPVRWWALVAPCLLPTLL